MAQTAFFTVILVLLLNGKRTEGSMMEVDIKCEEANYETTPIDAFAKECHPPAWEEFFLKPEVDKELKEITPVIIKEANKKNYPGIEPPLPNIFKALEKVAPNQIKVIILGQDPTPRPGQATGLAFSVANPRSVPTVMNILLEVALEGFKVDVNNGNLEKWANEGVLLLNTALTVERNKAGRHVDLWYDFTKLLIDYISKKVPPSAWLLWGKTAQEFKDGGLIDQTKHYVLTGGHPSALGGVNENTFFGGNYFQCANNFLVKVSRKPVDWSLVAGGNVLNPCPNHQGQAIQDSGLYPLPQKRNHD